jgi:BirA family transcriptional regulator, biotin operon repressor / biotin---[acetyl-CoA-carboxylase] ligase
MPNDAQLETLLARRTRFRRLVHVASCSSTQDLAAAEPHDGEAVFWADHQTQGRGRQQREWHDEPGADLAVTFRTRCRLPQPLALPAALPVAVLQAIEPLAGRALRIKWPNDLFLDGRKLCGLLIDAGAIGPDSYLIGIGVNCNSVRFPRELESIATSLAAATGQLVDRQALLAAIAIRLDALLHDLAARRHDALQAAFADRLGLVGRAVEIDVGSVERGELASVDFQQLRLADGRSWPLAITRAIRPAS